MTITVRSDFWGNSYNFVRAGDGKNSSLRKIIARLFNQRQSRDDRALLYALTGVAAGGTATATVKRIQHNRSELGGKRVIETETLVNRATTAADQTDLRAALLSYSSRPASYPVDKARKP